jgi:hypothetical protein
MLRSLGNGRLRLRFAAVELAHGIGANKPRHNLGGFRLLAFAVGLLGRRADERVFNEHVSLLLAVCYAQHVPGTQLVTTLASATRTLRPRAGKFSDSALPANRCFRNGRQPVGRTYTTAPHLDSTRNAIR